MTPQEYDAAEAEAIKKLPPDVAKAFQPVAFQSYAQQWCRRVTSLDQLGPWVDCMHQGTERIWANLGGLTEREFAAVKDVRDHAIEVSAAIGCSRAPKDALLQAVVPWRKVRLLMPRGASILELGPGSGYLGALLMRAGYHYTGFEITQPFYLWQSALGLQNLPWWYVREKMIDASWDLVVACHMLNEMSEPALKWLIADTISPIFVEGWGSVGIRPTAVTREMFVAAGWKIVGIERGPEASSHVIDLLLPPGPLRTVTRQMFEALK